MGATAETVVASQSGSKTHPMFYGSWTTDSTKGDHVITCPYHVACVMAFLNTGGTNVEILIKHIGETDESILLTGSTGVTTSPADSAGITITNNADGTSTIDIDSTSQTNSGTNQWLAWTKS